MDISNFWVDSSHLPAEKCGIHNPFVGPYFLSCECFCSMPLDAVVLSEIYLRGTRCIFIMFEDISKMYTSNVYLCFLLSNFIFHSSNFLIINLLNIPHPRFVSSHMVHHSSTADGSCEECPRHVHTYLHTYIPIIPTNCMWIPAPLTIN